MRKILIPVILAAAVIVGSACEPSTGCSEVPVPVGGDYSAHVWRDASGVIVGFAAAEDSTIWNRPGCH